MITRVISGGQTGVDRAALDVALGLGLACGGWCPKGRLAEDGPLPARYPVRETPLAGYAQRTAWNVHEADGTLIITHGPPTGGTAFTIEVAAQRRKPWLVLDLAKPPRLTAVRAWLRRHRICVLNVAGPRESQRPGISAEAAAVLRRLLSPRLASRGGSFAMTRRRPQDVSRWP